jgi:hypothetical protein
MEDLEDLMMMEAIRLSIAAEEDRKRKEEKDAAKEAKKEGKKKAKEIKKVAKAQKNISSGFHPIEIDGVDETEAGSSSAAGKGKGVVRPGGAVGFNPMSEPTSTINTSTLKEDPQKHLEVSRAQIQRETSDTGSSAPFDSSNNEQTGHRSALRDLSAASSSASSFADSYQNSLPQDSSNNLAPGSSYGPSPNVSGVSLGQTETPPQDTTGTEPMFNFQSLAKAINPEDENKLDNGPQYIEDVEAPKPDSNANGKAPESDPEKASEPMAGSTMTLKPSEDTPTIAATHQDDDIRPAPRVEVVQGGHEHLDYKRMEEVGLVKGLEHQATQ